MRATGGGGDCGGAAIGDGGGLAGVSQSGTTGHCSTNREHREREETKANSRQGIGRSGKGCTALAMTGGGRELTGVSG
jgi:hypothetical protein